MHRHRRDTERAMPQCYALLCWKRRCAGSFRNWSLGTEMGAPRTWAAESRCSLQVFPWNKASWDYVVTFQWHKSAHGWQRTVICSFCPCSKPVLQELKHTVLLFPVKSPPNGRDMSHWRGEFSITSPSNTAWRCSSLQPLLQDCWFPGSCLNCWLHWQIARTETALITDFTRPSIHLQFSSWIPPFRDLPLVLPSPQKVPPSVLSFCL